MYWSSWSLHTHRGAKDMDLQRRKLFRRCTLLSACGGLLLFFIVVFEGIVGYTFISWSVESEPERGTHFAIEFPLDVSASHEQAPPSDPAEPPAARQQRVLVAEDDEMVRRVTVVCLERAGYEILEVEDGAEALELLRGDGGSCAVRFRRHSLHLANAAIAGCRAGFFRHVVRLPAP